MKDIGEANVILDIKLLSECHGGVALLESHYIKKVLSRFGSSDYKPAPMSYDPCVLLMKNRRMARDQLRR